MSTYSTFDSQIIKELLVLKKPFVCFRKPLSKVVKCYIQDTHQTYVLPTEASVEGFVFAPFDSQEISYFIPSKHASSQYFHTPDFKAREGINCSPILNENAQKKHKDLVTKTIQFMQDGHVQKVVISRKITRNYDPKKLLLLFENILTHYTDAMVYLWFHSETGIWIGATPETLCSVTKNHFTTMSLAGTQVYREHLTWGQKEIKEQKIVTDYIQKELATICQEIHLSAPFTKKAGHLAHLCTKISGHFTRDISLKNVLDILHPTPAVCGTPKDAAKNFILMHEGYKRTFYTGYLGEILPDKTTEIYVNLRCMQISDNQLHIFVGGGITQESDPEKEWQETQEKSLTLLRFIDN